MFSSAIVVLALSASAFANVYTTSPISSTVWTGGQQATINWQDDNATPLLKNFGPSMVSIYAGNAQQQTLLQLITNSVDVSTTSTIQFTPDATIGPNSDEYFIRFQSLSLKDASQPQYPALAFSAKFTLSGMTGTFNSSVQAQIDGQSTAPLASQTAAVVGQTTSVVGQTTAASSTSKATSSSAHSGSSSTGTAKPTTSASAALGTKAGWAGIALSALLGVTMF